MANKILTMKGNHELFVRLKCKNQINRPTEKEAKLMISESHGNCLVCQPCLNNMICDGFVPVSVIPIYTEEENKQDYILVYK